MNENRSEKQNTSTEVENRENEVEQNVLFERKTVWLLPVKKKVYGSIFIQCRGSVFSCVCAFKCVRAWKIHRYVPHMYVNVSYSLCFLILTAPHSLTNAYGSIHTHIHSEWEIVSVSSKRVRRRFIQTLHKAKEKEIERENQRNSHRIRFFCLFIFLIYTTQDTHSLYVHIHFSL